ncbi:hypothetical protein ES332_D11G309000v1 [Gossypium tomentosum]|uniref:Uncharacterized protein n=1 Tax=Gossypium tomentosum TaxID=34277 RepID=A0A5D2IUK7_GOSTO|nr:hypothetical protein ES332_D11G309000v1 [Gossypium tomentosum]
MIQPYIALAIALYFTSKDDQAIPCCILEDQHKCEQHLVGRHVNQIFCPIRIGIHVKDYSITCRTNKFQINLNHIQMTQSLTFIPKSMLNNFKNYSIAHK